MARISQENSDIYVELLPDHLAREEEKLVFQHHTTLTLFLKKVPFEILNSKKKEKKKELRAVTAFETL